MFYAFGALLGWTGLCLALLDEPLAKAECVPFSGTLVHVQTTGRRSKTHYAVLRTASGELRARSNSWRINGAMLAAAPDSEFAGLLDDHAQIIVLSINDESVLNYEGYLGEFRFEQRLIGGGSLLIVVLCSYEWLVWYCQSTKHFWDAVPN